MNYFFIDGFNTKRKLISYLDEPIERDGYLYKPISHRAVEGGVYIAVERQLCDPLEVSRLSPGFIQILKSFPDHFVLFYGTCMLHGSWGYRLAGVYQSSMIRKTLTPKDLKNLKVMSGRLNPVEHWHILVDRLHRKALQKTANSIV